MRILSPHLINWFLVCCLMSTGAFSQDILQLPSAISGERGETIQIPVTGSNTNGGHVSITLEYPADVVRIVNAHGGETMPYHCTNFYIASDTTIGTRGLVILECWETVPAADVLLFLIEAEVLKGPGTTGTFRFDSIRRDRELVEGAILGAASISATSPATKPTGGDGFAGNYPNPGNGSGSFVFSLQAPMVVNLAVYDIRGTLVKRIQGINATAGENRFDLHFEEWELAQGPYLMVLEQETGVFVHPFLVMK